MKYDDAGWHNGNEFPKNSPPEYGGTHIALFLKWCFLKGWASEFHTDETPQDVEDLISGKLSATEFFFKNCDGKLTDEDFTPEGIAFANSYYGDDGLYLDDYSSLFADLMYEKPESDHDFASLSEIMESRFRSDILTQSQLNSSKPWWKFW